MESDLSTGCLEQILSGVDVDKPILQILGTRKITGSEGAERYRLLVSDGKYLNSFAMLATQLNHLSSAGQLSDNTIIQVDRYISSVVSKDSGEKRVLIILDLTVQKSGESVGRKLGNPQPYTPSSATTTNNAPTSSSVTKPMETSNNKPMTNSYNNNSRMDTSHNQSINIHLTNPISSLSPYKSKWVIKVRVVSKSPIRTWSNAKGEGKLFSMDLMDESGEIKATAFRNECEKFFDMIEVDKVYYISKCQLKPANKQYSSINNDYEMTFTNETVVQPCLEEEDNIPQIQYNWVPINQIANIEPKSAVDIIGICKETAELFTFTGKNNKEYKKKELTLVDSSNAAVCLTLWGEDAVKFDGHVQPVVAVKNGVVAEFGGGKSVSVGNGSVFKINPDLPEGHRLRGWFDNGGGANISSNISARSATGGMAMTSDFTNFHETKIKNIGSGDKPDYFQVKAVVHLTKSANSIYKACPQPECNKKVIDEGNGHYRCEKCNALTPNFKFRMLLNMSIGDWTSSRWVSCFNEQAEKILGKSAEEIGTEVENDPETIENIFSAVHFQSFVFKCRSKLEIYGDTQRSKIIVTGASNIVYKDYNKYLVKNLNTLLGVGKN